jgi:hypothetical protein
LLNSVPSPCASPISKLDRGRPTAKRNNLADKFTVEAKALAEPKVDLGPVRIWRRSSAPVTRMNCAAVVHPGGGHAARSGGGATIARRVVGA